MLGSGRLHYKKAGFSVEVFYDRQKRRLVYFGESSSPDFWDKLFDTENFKKSIQQGKDDWFILRILRKYLPDKRGPILEGGCGEGRIVYGMHAHGYESIGIDFAQNTLQRTKKLFPELNIAMGDVRKLPFLDTYFVAYWSMGVIEHLWEGYQEILKEMQRVLVDGGYVFLSFPYMSPLRRLKAKLGLYKEFDGGERENFYQFALNQDLVVRDFAESGFKLIDKKASAGIKGFKDEIRVFKPLLQRLFSYRGRNLLIRGLRFMLDITLATFAGHMIFMVLQKVRGNPEPESKFCYLTEG